MARLQEFYKETVMPQLKEKFSYGSVMEIPRITKITLNMGVGEGSKDEKILVQAEADHRHHAVDAVAIALTSHATLKQISQAIEISWSVRSRCLRALKPASSS